MATGDVINVVSSYATCQAAASTADGALCGGSRTAIGAALAATVEDYPLLDFRVTVSSGTPVALGTIDIYRIPGDGTNSAPAPETVAGYLEQYVGSVTLDDAAVTQYYFLHGVVNMDQDDEYCMINNDGATLTIALAVRGRSSNLAA